MMYKWRLDLIIKKKQQTTTTSNHRTTGTYTIITLEDEPAVGLAAATKIIAKRERCFTVLQ